MASIDDYSPLRLLPYSQKKHRELCDRFARFNSHPLKKMETGFIPSKHIRQSGELKRRIINKNIESEIPIVIGAR
jgi:hypothetical protein